jgi:DNA ligase-1
LKEFARLLVDLAMAPSTNAKKALMKAHFAHVPDPARGLALAGLAGGLSIGHVKPAVFRELAASRVDPVLFDLSYDFVGDLAETVALIWPAPADPGAAPALPDLVASLQGAAKADIPALLAGILDRLDADARWALLKLVLGGTRVGVSARLAKTALAEYGAKDVAEIEEIWPGLVPPYLDLFAWLDGRGERPAVDASAAFRPMMLAQPLDVADLADMDPVDWRAEWKWDGVRVQLAAAAGRARVWTRTGEEIGAAFPEFAAAGFDAVLDGELLVRADGETGSFADLQQRLNRKKPDAALRAKLPAFVRVYDLLFAGGEDLRALPFDERRARLEAWHAANPDPRFDLSPPVAFADWDELKALRAGARERAMEGLMLKRAAGVYLSGRPKGEWFKWKRDPRRVDAVLVYAQRGHGKRSSFYSDFTFACWNDEDRLVPVAKAYSGYSDAELKRLDKFVRDHTTDRHGPVRVVEPSLVVELEFDAVQLSARHKSGVALRFPRVARVRWDKPAAQADRVATLAAMVEDGRAARIAP